MKSARLIAFGLVLILAGIVGFSSNLSRVDQSGAQAESAGDEREIGFLPIAFPVENPLGAPTLQPTTAPDLSDGRNTPVTTTQISPTGTPTPAAPLIPDRIVIPAIDLDAPVIPAEEEKVAIDGVEYYRFLAPDQFAAGWHSNSASLGEAGNTVLNGHHNVYGEVFANLVYLQPGDRIFVYSASRSVEFQVANVLLLKERDASLEKRIENARWIEPSNDVRLTLVTCWPEYTNTHRLIVVASPVPGGNENGQE